LLTHFSLIGYADFRPAARLGARTRRKKWAAAACRKILSRACVTVPRGMGYKNGLEYHEGIEGWAAAGQKVEQARK
jgi:hypothetical protein